MKKIIIFLVTLVTFCSCSNESLYGCEESGCIYYWLNSNVGEFNYARKNCGHRKIDFTKISYNTDSGDIKIFGGIEITIKYGDLVYILERYDRLSNFGSIVPREGIKVERCYMCHYDNISTTIGNLYYRGETLRTNYDYTYIDKEILLKAYDLINGNEEWSYKNKISY